MKQKIIFTITEVNKNNYKVILYVYLQKYLETYILRISEVVLNCLEHRPVLSNTELVIEKLLQIEVIIIKPSSKYIKFFKMSTYYKKFCNLQRLTSVIKINWKKFLFRNSTTSCKKEQRLAFIESLKWI